MELKNNFIPNWEGAVLNAIKEAKIANKRVTHIGLPRHIQKEIVINMIKSTGKEVPEDIPNLKTIYGIRVRLSETPEIATEFGRIKQ